MKLTEMKEILKGAGVNVNNVEAYLIWDKVLRYGEDAYSRGLDEGVKIGKEVYGAE